MDIYKFTSQFRNHPILFIGTGISKRYLNKAYSWDELLESVAVQLYGSDEEYIDIKSETKDKDGKFQYCRIASVLEEDFNEMLKRPENREGRFKEINDVYYKVMREHEKDISRFKIYLSQLLQDTSIKENAVDELRYFQSIKKHVGSIITTNYDTFIEDNLMFNPLIGNEIIQSNPYGSVYKIHGCVSCPEQIIITADDYKRFEIKYDLIRAQLISLFIHNPIIFIGYSIEDENIKSILKTIFSYVEPNSDIAKKIKANFLLVEYKEGSNNINVNDYDISIDESTIIGINKIKTDNFIEIYKALTETHIQISIMDIRKVQTIVGEIVKGNSGGMQVSIPENIDDLSNDKMVLMITHKENISYRYLPLNEFFGKYFYFIENNDKQAISLIDKQKIQNNQYFPIFGFNKINNKLDSADKLKEQQIDLLQKYMNKGKTHNADKSKHTSINSILDDSNIALTYKEYFIMWCVWNKQIPIDELERHLKTWDKEKNTPFRRLLCLYDYIKYGIQSSDAFLL